MPARPESLPRAFWLAVAITLALRFVLAAWLPITGDEAYFIYWGEQPDYGFYDHPPMVGWFLWLMLQFSHDKVMLRLPVIVLPALVAIGMMRLLRDQDDGRAYVAALAWLLVPAQVLNVAITTDTPLQLFAFLSVAAFYVALKRDSTALYALAGACLGLAFLSKYFAVLLGFAYFMFALLSPRAERRWKGVLIAFAAAAPFVLVNVAWNYEHCWANLMFNVYNRHGDAGWSSTKPLLFVVLALYVTSPVLLWQLVRRTGIGHAFAAEPGVRLLLVCSLVPLAVFAALSPVKNVGLHWLLSFIPPLFLAGALLLTRTQLVKSVIFLGVFSGVHVAALAVIAALPIETWRNVRQYDGVIQTFRADEVFSALKPYEGKFHFAADGYSPAVTLSYNAAEHGFGTQPGAQGWRAHYFFVFGPASSHARHDDILTDFRPLDGRDILVLRKHPPEAGQYEPFFRRVEVREIEVRGARFHVVLGYGFDHASYRERVLADMRERYYRIPAYLPQGHCYFCERYFATATCPAR